MYEYLVGSVYQNRHHPHLFKRVTELGNENVTGGPVTYEKGVNTDDWLKIECPDWPTIPPELRVTCPLCSDWSRQFVVKSP